MRSASLCFVPSKKNNWYLFFLVNFFVIGFNLRFNCQSNIIIGFIWLNKFCNAIHNAVRISICLIRLNLLHCAISLWIFFFIFIQPSGTTEFLIFFIVVSEYSSLRLIKIIYHPIWTIHKVYISLLQLTRPLHLYILILGISRIQWIPWGKTEWWCAPL